MDTNISIQFFDMIGASRKLYARFMEPLCRKWELNQNEIDVMMFLYNHPDKDRAADISSERGIAKSYVSQAVTALEKRELLTRNYDPTDRRAAHLVLTPGGRDIAREGRQIQKAFFHALYRDITPEESAIWGKILCRIAENIGSFPDVNGREF